MKKYRNVAFLAELLINILVFSISCAILAGLFGKASLLARQTKEETFASAKVYAIVETIKVRGIDGVDGGQEQPDGSLMYRYDEDWNIAQEKDTAFIILLTVEPEKTDVGFLHHIHASAKTNEGRELYNLETAEYRSGEEGSSL